VPAFPPFIGGSYQSQSPIADQERSINWYPEIMEVEGATSRASLYPTPGVETFATVADVGGRAMLGVTDIGVERCFGVLGSTLYEFYDDGSDPVSRGTVAIDANPATISTSGDGGRELLVTSGDVGYAYNLSTNALSTVVSSGATKGGTVFGYGVVFNIADSSIRISDQFDMTTWDATQTAQRTIGSDPWRTMHITPYGYICLPGTKSGEFWYNAGASPFPFQPEPSALYAWGIAAPFSIAQVGRSVMWLGQSPEGGYQVVSAQGFSPQRVSTHALEFQLSGYERVSDAIGQSYTEDGHTFYVLTVPSANITHVFDQTTAGIWHERGTWNSAAAEWNVWKPVFHAYAFGKHLMADRETGTIHRLSNTIATDVNGNGIRRVRRFPALVADREWLLHTRLRLLYEQGIGLTSGQGSDPMFMLRYSNDGGRTWGNERQIAAGKLGEYAWRADVRRLGRSRNRVYELSVSDPIVGWRLSEVYLDAEPAL